MQFSGLALSWLHKATSTLKVKSKDISHCDVRLPNICFDEHYNPALIDFDFGVFLLTIEKICKYLVKTYGDCTQEQGIHSL